MKKSVSTDEKKPKKDKKSVFPMPFVPVAIDSDGCAGLAYNRGLFTQCTKKRMENGPFCKGCQTQADKNETGCPDCGTVDSRLATGLYQFKDPKGRSPVSYVTVLEKLKLNVDAALEESGKLNIKIPDEHFVVLAEAKEKSKKEPVARGRPKKTAAVEAENLTDLFAKLSSEEEVIEEVIEDGEVSEEQKPVKSSRKQTKTKISEEEKAAKKALLEEERAAKKQEREAKRELERQEREAKRAAEKALAEQKKASKTKKPDEHAEPVKPVKVTVTRIKINGQTYLKSSTNILYDFTSKEEIGIWDPISNEIKPLPEEDDDEEQESEYESDD